MLGGFVSWLGSELGLRVINTLVAFCLGAGITWSLTRWRRLRERRLIQEGEAHNTFSINYHVVESEDVEDPANPGQVMRRPRTLRIRSLGRGSLHHVIPNSHLAGELLARLTRVTASNPLIAMNGPEGSYLLETLTDFVCERAGNEPFDHDLYVMAPCYEPAALAAHRPITILLIAVRDLVLFDSWARCRETQVEHGEDGARILTLMALAQHFTHERSTIASLRKEGRRTRYVETMFLLDLALDRRATAMPTKAVPWNRYETVLKQLNLE
jgi:hypothetical protein